MCYALAAAAAKKTPKQHMAQYRFCDNCFLRMARNYTAYPFICSVSINKECPQWQFTEKLCFEVALGRDT